MFGRKILVAIALIALLIVPPLGSAAQDDAADLAHARQLLDNGRIDEGMTLLQKLSADQPSLKGLAHQWGVAYYKKGSYSQAVLFLQQALQEDADDKEATQLLGLSYYFSGKTSDAIPLLEHSQAWYQTANIDALYVLGLCYMFVHNYDAARSAFAKMFGTRPDSAASYLFAAQMFMRHDVNDMGAIYCQKAILLDPRLPLAHYLLGELYLTEVKVPEAVVAFQKEIEINPGFAGVYYRLADANLRLEKYDDAERLLQRSIWLDPNSTGPYILLGKVLEKKGEYALAARMLEHALTMDPNNQLPHLLLGQAYHRLGRNEDAEREFKLSEQLRLREHPKPQ
jgi:tetratricopeptide (TPR) repeat protein